MDNFYKKLTPELQKLAFESKYDFDSPNAFDMDLFVETVRDLKAGYVCLYIYIFLQFYMKY